MIRVANTGMEATHATCGDRRPAFRCWMADQPGHGNRNEARHRAHAAVEVLNETEYETEVAGTLAGIRRSDPSLRFRTMVGDLYLAAAATGRWRRTIRRQDKSLHLIEKTGQEVRLKLEYNFWNERYERA